MEIHGKIIIYSEMERQIFMERCIDKEIAEREVLLKMVRKETKIGDIKVLSILETKKMTGFSQGKYNKTHIFRKSEKFKYFILNNGNK